jgi:hypothetical protein
MRSRTVILWTALILLGAGGLLAADKPIVGTWQLISDTPGGEQMRFTLVVKEEGGKLSGTLTGGIGQFPLVDPKLEGDSFTCKISIDDQTYTIESKVSGTKFEGGWKGGGAQGAIKGTKES